MKADSLVLETCECDGWHRLGQVAVDACPDVEQIAVTILPAEMSDDARERTARVVEYEAGAPIKEAGAFASLGQRLMGTLLGKGVLSIGDQALVSGTSFVTSVLIGRYCSQSDLGWFALSISLASLARAIQEQLISAPYMVYASRRSTNELPGYTGSSLVSHGLLTGVALLTVGGMWLAARGGLVPTGLAPVLPWLLLALPWLLLREHLRQTAYAQLRPLIAIGVDVCATVIQLAGLYLLAKSGWISVPSALLTMGLACGVACGAFFCCRAIPVRFSANAFSRDWKTNWNFGRWALASHLLGSTAPYLLPWMVVLLHDEQAAGLLAAASTLAGLANLFVQGLSNFLTPQASRAYSAGGTRELRQMLSKVATVFTLCLGSICGMAWLSGGWALTRLYGEAYAPAAISLGLLVTATLINSWGMVTGNGLWAMDKARANFRADGCAMLVTLLTAGCLVGPWGATGAAFATLAGVAAGTLVRLVTLLACLHAEERSVARQSTAGREAACLSTL